MPMTILLIQIFPCPVVSSDTSEQLHSQSSQRSSWAWATRQCSRPKQMRNPIFSPDKDFRNRKIRKWLDRRLGKLLKMDECPVQFRATLTFEDTGAAVRYFSFTALSLEITLGSTDAKPGMKLRTQINSFSIQLRSWLLQTEMMKTVCRRENHREKKLWISYWIILQSQSKDKFVQRQICRKVRYQIGKETR